MIEQYEEVDWQLEYEDQLALDNASVGPPPSDEQEQPEPKQFDPSKLESSGRKREQKSVVTERSNLGAEVERTPDTPKPRRKRQGKTQRLAETMMSDIENKRYTFEQLGK